MKHLLALLLLAACAATAQGQIIKSLGYNTNGEIVATNRIFFSRLGGISGTAADPSISMLAGTNIFGIFSASSAAGIGPHLGFSVNGSRSFLIATNTIRAELPISFDNTTNAATTRTNLGLYATNAAAVFAANRLWDNDNEEWAAYVEGGGVIIQLQMVNTNAPANTTNAVRWIDVQAGTNFYKIPLFQ